MNPETLVNLAVYFLLGLFIQGNISDPIEAFMQIFIEVFITLSFIAALLFRDGSSYNFERFLTAILVCENFVYVIGLPILFWFIFAKGSEYASYPIYLGALLRFYNFTITCGESLFLRKLVLGIPAQASSKNLTRPLMPSAPQTSCVRATSPRPS